MQNHTDGGIYSMVKCYHGKKANINGKLNSFNGSVRTTVNDSHN